MAEFLQFNACQDVDQFFRESRVFFNQEIVEKLPQLSIYYGSVNTETWPENTLPTQQGFRLGRGYYDVNGAWHEVTSARCEQNSCDSQFEVIAHPGSESYQWQLLNRNMKTDWYCLTDFLYRLFPMEEVDHIVKTNAIITATVHEEFIRSNWIKNSQYRWTGTSSSTSIITCDELQSDGFIIKDFTGAGEGGPDMRYVYVNRPASELALIPLLSLDQLDEALILLQRQDDAYRLDISEQAGRPMLQIILPDVKVGRDLWRQGKESGGWWDANTDFDSKQAQYALGIDRTIGNYAFCYDINAPRYNVDWTYNNALGAFSAADIDTWPRLIRVMPYVKRSSDSGACIYDPSPAYQHADFSFAVAWVQKALTKWSQRGNIGAGEAQGMTQDFTGTWQWENPPWECNLKRNQGFFWNQFVMAMQIKDPTLMNSFLIRLNKSKLIPGACCDLNTDYTAPSDIDCFTCTGE